jgi:hypothetical protein
MKTTRRFRRFACLTGCAFAGAALAQDTLLKPIAASAEPTVFKEVVAKLDPGGSLYLYLSTDQWLGALSARVRDIRDFVLALPDVEGEGRAKVEQVFRLADNLVKRSGVEAVAGVGASGIAVEKGFYRTRFVAQRAAGSPGGYFWEWFGAKPHPLAALDWLPADTAWAFFADLDLRAIWAALEREAGEAQLDPLLEGLKQLSAQVEQATGHSLPAQLDALGGELGVALVLDSATKIKLPLPNGEEVELPEPALLVAVKVKNDQLFDWLDKAMAENPQSTRGEAGGARWRSLAVPAPVPFPLRPTVARAGDYLWLTSSDTLFERVRKAKTGEAPGLKGAAEFQKLARDLPASGNSFNFVSARFSEAMTELQKAAMRQAANQPGNPTVLMELFQRFMGLADKPASYAVGWVDDSGMHSVSQGNQEPTTVLISSAVVAPTAVMAGMMLPALAKAKTRAQDIMCLNNLKQIALALIMYADDHDETLPKDFVALKPYLGGPVVLFCPQDPQRPDVQSPTWDDFELDRCSYEFLEPEMKLPPADPATTVIARCKIHGHAAYADGHAELRKDR